MSRKLTDQKQEILGNKIFLDLFLHPRSHRLLCSQVILHTLCLLHVISPLHNDSPEFRGIIMPEFMNTLADDPYIIFQYLC